MNDVTWHYINDPETGLAVNESYNLLRQFGDSNILIETNVTFRLSLAEYFDPCSERMEDSNERLIRFAFVQAHTRAGAETSAETTDSLPKK